MWFFKMSSLALKHTISVLITGHRMIPLPPKLLWPMIQRRQLLTYFFTGNGSIIGSRKKLLSS